MGFSVSPSSARFATSISSILVLDPLHYLFRASRMSQGKFGIPPFLQHHDPTLLSHSHHLHPCYGKVTMLGISTDSIERNICRET